MPVQEQTPYIKYVANGVTQTFATEFDCESKDQLVVMLNGEEPAFTSWSYADKQVTFATAPVVDTVVELKRQSKLNRTTDYQSFNHTLNYKALNSDFDRIWYAIQEQNYKVGQYDYDYNFVLTQVRPIATGGTGADNPNDARNNLDVHSKAEVLALVQTGGAGEVLSIESGGTGGMTVEAARTNLDVYSQSDTDEKIETAIATFPNATETVAGKAKIATTAIAQAGVNDTDFLTAKKLRDALNAGGNAPVSASRAWVVFNAASGGVTILNSLNVSSVVRTATGKYTINFATPLPTANYALMGFCPRSSTNSVNSVALDASVVPASTSVSIMVNNSSNAVDLDRVSFGVFC